MQLRIKAKVKATGTDSPLHMINDVVTMASYEDDDDDDDLSDVAGIDVLQLESSSDSHRLYEGLHDMMDGTLTHQVTDNGPTSNESVTVE